jgi:hypothetical protein
MTTCTPTQNTAEESIAASPRRSLVGTANQQSEVRMLATKRGQRAIDEPKLLLFVFLLQLPFLLLLTWLLSQLSSMPEPVHP